MHGTNATAQGWRNVTLVREHDHRRTRSAFGLVAGIVIAFLPFVVYLLRQIDYVHARYEIEELRSQHQRLVEAERRLQVEIAALEALPRVEERAARDIGLVPAAPDRVLVIRSVLPGTAPVRGPDGDPPAAP